MTTKKITMRMNSKNSDSETAVLLATTWITVVLLHMIFNHYTITRLTRSNNTLASSVSYYDYTRFPPRVFRYQIGR